MPIPEEQEAILIDVKRLKALLEEALPCVDTAEALCRRYGATSGADYKGDLSKRINAALGENKFPMPDGEEKPCAGVDVKQYSREALRAQADEIDEALVRTRNLDLSKADLVTIKSTSSTASEIDRLLSAHIVAHVEAKYGRKCIVSVIRPEESIETMDESAALALYGLLKKRFES